MRQNLRVADRSNLRIADLKNRAPKSTRLMNVKIPGHLLDQIAKLANQISASKTAVVIALLEAGLEKAGRLDGVRGRKGK